LDSGLAHFKASTHTEEMTQKKGDIYPSLERDSNLQSQCSKGLRHLYLILVTSVVHMNSSK